MILFNLDNKMYINFLNKLERQHANDCCPSVLKLLGFNNKEAELLALKHPNGFMGYQLVDLFSTKYPEYSFNWKPTDPHRPNPIYTLESLMNIDITGYTNVWNKIPPGFGIFIIIVRLTADKTSHCTFMGKMEDGTPYVYDPQNKWLYQGVRENGIVINTSNTQGNSGPVNDYFIREAASALFYLNGHHIRTGTPIVFNKGQAMDERLADKLIENRKRKRTELSSNIHKKKTNSRSKKRAKWSMPLRKFNLGRTPKKSKRKPKRKSIKKSKRKSNRKSSSKSKSKKKSSSKSKSKSRSKKSKEKSMFKIVPPLPTEPIGSEFATPKQTDKTISNLASNLKNKLKI